MPSRTVYEVPEAFSGTYVLEFSDPSFEGLEVVMGRHSFGAIDAAARMMRINRAAVDRGELDPDDWAALNTALAEFASALVSWNLVDRDGRAVPATLARIKQLDLLWVLQVFMVWVRALVGVEFGDIEDAELPMEAVG